MYFDILINSGRIKGQCGVLYSTTGNPSSVSQLSTVISSHKEYIYYITMTTKSDILAREAPLKDEIITTDEQKVAKCLHFINFIFTILARKLVKF